MSLAPKSCLRACEVREPIGAGGRGEVYQEVNSAAAWRSGVPRSLFDPRRINPVASFAASRDGKRFLVPTLVDETTPSTAAIVLNWTAGIRE